jgi:AraC family transcriptional regulator
MQVVGPCEFDRIVFDSGLVRVGAFRSHPSHPSFRDSGPSRNFCFVFPRTAVGIQHEHEPAFVANPNVVTFYNQGQPYLRSAISPDGDRCDWFGADVDIVRDVVRAFDPAVEERPEMPFKLTHGPVDAHTYLSQRRLFRKIATGQVLDSFAVEELVVHLLARVVRSAYGTQAQASRSIRARHRDIVRHVEFILSARLESGLTLRHIAGEVGMSVYHLCRLFYRATGMTLHDYRQKLRLRWSLESVVESRRPLVDIALEAGFSSHSHFTSSFHREFDQTPSRARSSEEIDSAIF